MHTARPSCLFILLRVQRLELFTPLVILWGGIFNFRKAVAQNSIGLTHRFHVRRPFLGVFELRRVNTKPEH
ncbi:hypothetical protein CC2G_002620 [Coprinopsis cinerea AmutBmut pab1-1]|nr:hypothetical protein CC2G_002620 [Coprinopsis cinerea AmutBmut pab1-1]